MGTVESEIDEFEDRKKDKKTHSNFVMLLYNNLIIDCNPKYF